VSSFLDRYFQLEPVAATIAGEHRYDRTWPDLSATGDKTKLAFLDDVAKMVASFKGQGLSEQHQVDLATLDDVVQYARFQITELKALDSNPAAYTGVMGEGLDPLVNRTFQTPELRIGSLRGRLDGIPAIVEAAKARLQHPAKIYTQQAIQQNAGLIALVEVDLPKQHQELATAAKRAAAALHDFQTFLEKDLLARSDGDFRLGKDKFARKLAFELQDNLDADALAQRAREAIAQTQEEMVDTGKQIWSDDKMGRLPKLDTPAQKKAFVKQVLDHVAKDRPTNKTILADAKTWLDKATAFVKEKDLVRVPDEPVLVVEMPEYRRGFSVAYCDSSGPLEAKPETFYAISPTPKDWPRARVESFYREYNQAMLAELSIHEAMPGHYLQGMHNNQFPSKLRGVFNSGPFVEGWAVYGEWLMAEKGFGGSRVKLEREKMLLRAALNAVLDHDIHTGNLDEKAAIAMMKSEAFQEDGEAVGKWKRAQLSSAQLSTYFYGFSELLALRKSLEGQPGFSERAYHDKLLSFGSPGIKYIRQLMAPKP